MAEEGMSEADALRLQSLLSAEDEDDELDYSAPAPAPDASARSAARTRATAPAPAAPESQVGADEALARASWRQAGEPGSRPTRRSRAPSRRRSPTRRRHRPRSRPRRARPSGRGSSLHLEAEKEAPPPPTKPATPPPPPPANTTCFVAVVGFDHARGNVLEWAFPGAEAAWSESLPFAALPDGAHHVAAGKGEVCRFAVVREKTSHGSTAAPASCRPRPKS